MSQERTKSVGKWLGFITCAAWIVTTIGFVFDFSSTWVTVLFLAFIGGIFIYSSVGVIQDFLLVASLSEKRRVVLSIFVSILLSLIAAFAYGPELIATFFYNFFFGIFAVVGFNTWKTGEIKWLSVVIIIASIVAMGTVYYALWLFSQADSLDNSSDESSEAMLYLFYILVFAGSLSLLAKVRRSQVWSQIAYRAMIAVNSIVMLGLVLLIFDAYGLISTGDFDLLDVRFSVIMAIGISLIGILSIKYWLEEDQKQEVFSVPSSRHVL